MVFNGRLGNTSLDNAFGLFFFGCITIVFIQFTNIGLKNATAKIIWNNGFSTTCGNYTRAGFWAIFTLGDLRAFEWDHLGNDGILIVPIDTINKSGKCIHITSSAYIAPYDELPPDVRTVVKEDGLKAPFLLGFGGWDMTDIKIDVKKITEDLKKNLGVTDLNEVDANLLIQHIRQLHKQNWRLEEELKSANLLTEEQAGHIKRVQETFDRNKGDKKLIKILTRRSEEE